MKFIFKYVSAGYILLLFLSPALFAQNSSLPIQWAVNAGSPSYDYAEDMAIDREGNIYVIGSFEGLISFGSFELQSLGSYDILLLKYNSAGEILWARSAGGQGYDTGLSIAIDNSGNAVFTGTYDVFARFDNISIEGHSGDIFVAKYTRNGDPVWVKSGGGESYDLSLGIAADNLDNVIITGNLQGPANFDSVFIGSSQFADIFTAKYDAQGNVLWVRSAGNTDYDVGYSVAVNQANEIFVTGSFSGSIFFENRLDVLNSNGGQDIFIVKYNANGTYMWSRSAGGPNYDNGTDLKIDDRGDLIITGSFSDTVSFGSITLTSIGYSDLFVAKYDPVPGEPVWVSFEGEVNTNYDATDVTTDTYGNISVIGRIADSREINSSLITRYTSDGNKSGEYNLVSSNSINPAGIEYNAGNDLIFSGAFSEVLTLGSFNLTSNGSQDIFLAHLIIPRLQLSAASVVYEQVTIGESSRESVFLENPGNAILTVNDLQLAGPDAESFSVVSGNNFVINPNATVEVPVEFSPGRAGLHQAFLIIFSDASTNPDTAELIATGVLLPPLLSNVSINFGNVIIGNSRERVIRLSNPNNIDLQVTGVISPEDIEDFTISDFNQTIPAVGFVDITIQFTPVSDGLRSAELKIYGEGFADSVSADLIGTGAIPALNLSTRTVDLGTIDVNNPAETSVTVENGGPVDVIISGVSFTGANADEFRLTRTPVPDTITPGSNKNFVIRIVPISTGEKTALMLISSNTFNSPDTISLSAVAEIAALSFSTDTLDFSNVYINSPVEQTITLTNNNISDIIISGSEITGEDVNEFVLLSGSEPDTLTSNETKDFIILLNAVSAGDKSAELVVYSNSSGSPDIVPLKAFAISSSLTYSDPEIDFGNSAVSGTVDKSLNVINGSQAQIIIEDAVFVGTDWIEFSLINTPLPDTLESNESKNFTVRITPASSGTKSAYLVIISNSTESPDSISLNASAFISPLTFSEERTDFGIVDVNSSVSKILKINNPGPSTVIINNIDIAGTDSNYFSLLNADVPDTLKPLTERSLQLEFTPAASGIKNAFLIINSNSIDSPDSIELTGSALSLVYVESDEINVGLGAELNIIPPPGFAFNDNKIFYRRSGERFYTEGELAASETGYLANIPAAFSTIRGIEYYIVFSDGINTVTFPVNDPANNPAVLPTHVAQFNYPQNLAGSVYKMISIPLNVTNSQIDSILIDDFGSYDKSLWRILRWNQNIGAYLEYPGLEKDFTPGNAFWIIHRNEASFDIENAESVPSDRPYLIELDNGWNQIGNPFSFPVTWDSIGNSQLVQPPVFWNPGTNDYELDKIILEPWEGYWIYNPAEALSLSVEPVDASIEVRKKKNLFAGNEGEFILQIKALNSTGVQDAQNFVGMMKDAAAGRDKYDILEPPAISDNLRLTISSGDREFARDIVSVSGEGAFWELKIINSQQVTLYFENVTELPEDFKIWLLDLNRMISVPVNENKASLHLGDEAYGTFRLIIGNEKYAETHSENVPLVPLEYTLYQNYPNPFNPSTTISYQLREKSNVTLEIFDILGEKVAALSAGDLQNPGVHHYTWNPSNIASGIYIYRLQASSFTASKMMLLLK